MKGDININEIQNRKNKQHLWQQQYWEYLHLEVYQ